MKRIILFLVTNLAVMLVLSATLSILGVNRFMTAQGLNIQMLLIFSLIVGFTGSFISLLMSKPMAKWSTGAQVIDPQAPGGPRESWLVDTVHQLADRAGIGRPEVAIYEGEPNAFATGAFKNESLVAVSTGLLDSMTEEEISASLVEGVDAGVIEQHEHQMVQNVFNLDERPLTSIMVHRSDIEWLDAKLPVPQALAQVGASGAHSWYPVCRGDLDNVVGAVSVSQLLRLPPGTDMTVEALAKPVAFVPETLSGMDLLEQFRKPAERATAHGRMVLVVDEYGVVHGLLTPRDLLEAITGELLQATPTDEAWATQREDGTWLIDGMMPVTEFKARLGIKELPDEDRGIYNTVAGLVMAISGELPTVSDVVAFGEWRFEVIDLDGRRIDKLLVSRVHLPVG